MKTENMLLDKTRTVKIADFGVARVEAQNPNDMTGETGTLGYMAPEVGLLLCSIYFMFNIFVLKWGAMIPDICTSQCICVRPMRHLCHSSILNRYF